MKRPEWKQPTPEMQLQVILMSIQGHCENYQEGIIDIEKFGEVCRDHNAQLVELMPYVGTGSWDLPRKGIFARLRAAIRAIMPTRATGQGNR